MAGKPFAGRQGYVLVDDGGTKQVIGMFETFDSAWQFKVRMENARMRTPKHELTVRNYYLAENEEFVLQTREKLKANRAASEIAELLR